MVLILGHLYSMLMSFKQNLFYKTLKKVPKYFRYLFFASPNKKNNKIQFSIILFLVLSVVLIENGICLILGNLKTVQV